MVLGLVLDITFYIVWKNIQYSKHFSIGIKFKLIQGIKVIYPVPVLIEVFIGNPKDSFTIIQSTFYIPTQCYRILHKYLPIILISFIPISSFNDNIFLKFNSTEFTQEFSEYNALCPLQLP